MLKCVYNSTIKISVPSKQKKKNSEKNLLGTLIVWESNFRKKSRLNILGVNK